MDCDKLKFIEHNCYENNSHYLFSPSLSAFNPKYTINIGRLFRFMNRLYLKGVERFFLSNVFLNNDLAIEFSLVCLSHFLMLPDLPHPATLVYNQSRPFSFRRAARRLMVPTYTHTHTYCVEVMLT